jgi:PII-like signaling protein
MRERGLKLTVYFSERTRARHGFLADALFDVYERHLIHTSVLLRGADGFGHHHHLHTDRLLSSSENLPAVSIAVGARERVEEALPEVREVAEAGGLVTLERLDLVTGYELEHLQLHDAPGAQVKLTLFGGRRRRAAGEAGYVAAVERLAGERAAGASVLLAVDGMLHGRRHRARFFARNADVPLMLIALGSPAQLQLALPDLIGMLDAPVATLERVQVCKAEGVAVAGPPVAAAGPGVAAAGPPAGGPHDPNGSRAWQKLTIHVEEQARHGAHPVHSALLLALRDAGAAGATALRGVLGFYGEREPFADRFLSLRRHAPVLLVVIDRPEQVRSWWPRVDEITAEHGLVTSELVPISFTAG